MKNKYGLDRKIPPDIKRAVRQRCGFGCVVCGLGIIEYEHVDPEFHEAQKHDADKIALLVSSQFCGGERKTSEVIEAALW